jgi:hypothetical protein
MNHFLVLLRFSAITFVNEVKRTEFDVAFKLMVQARLSIMVVFVLLRMLGV